MGEKDYFPRVESYLGKYQRWKSRLAIIEEELKRLEPKVTSAFSDTPPSVTNKTSDNTGDVGTKRADLIAERDKLLDRVRKIEIALEALSKDQKELFELRYIHKVDVEDIKDVMNIGKNNYYRLRNSLVNTVHEIIQDSIC